MQGVVHGSICVSTAVVPGHVGFGNRIVGRLVRADGAVDEELQQVGSEHVPVVVVVLLAVFAADDEAADASVGEQGFVDGEVGQVFFHGESLMGIEWLARFDRVEGCGRVGGVAGEGVRGQTGRQLITHSTTVRRWCRSAPAVRRTCSVGGVTTA